MSRSPQASGEARIPRLVPGWEQKAGGLSSQEGYLLSRIDGNTSWELLRSIGGLPPEQVDLALKQWIADGLVELASAAAAKSVTPEAPKPAPGEDADLPEVDRGQIDPELDLDVALQEKILRFEAGLDGSYHDILGIARDADGRAVKRAYFKLSKDFHPDRYFQRSIGEYEQRLDRIFKKVALAYELLMDPMTRTELERSFDAGPVPAGRERPEAARSGASPQQSKREWLQRVRKQFRIPERVLVERRARARELADAARVAQHHGNSMEALSSIRLAIAFDPWNEDHKEVFAEIRVGVHRERSDELLAEARQAVRERSLHEALRLFEEILHYRPGDAAAHGEAAEVALQVENYVRAAEYAERACELDPERASHHLALGRALSNQGQRVEAHRALDKARKLDPRDTRILQELSKLRPQGRAGGGVG